MLGFVFNKVKSKSKLTLSTKLESVCPWVEMTRIIPLLAG